MSSIRTLLIIEDNPGDIRLLREILTESDPHQSEIIHAETVQEAVQHSSIFVSLWHEPDQPYRSDKVVGRGKSEVVGSWSKRR